ncbi:MAG: hypothetical protein WDO15_18590 [Bacteroidota bacterium]
MQVPFWEVFKTGQRLLRNDRFQVYENNDLVGVELAGVLKNIIAIASGALNGLGYGENAKGLLISSRCSGNGLPRPRIRWEHKSIFRRGRYRRSCYNLQ